MWELFGAGRDGRWGAAKGRYDIYYMMSFPRGRCCDSVEQSLSESHRSHSKGLDGKMSTLFARNTQLQKEPLGNHCKEPPLMLY
jgi:hypothetical protein